MNLIEPTSIRRAASPGETVTQDFIVQRVPNGTLVASISGGDSVMRLTRFVALKQELHNMTEDEIRELPPRLRPPHGHPMQYVEFVEVGHAGPGEPLHVTSDLLVHGEVEFIAAAGQEPTSVAATLVVEGWPNRRAEIPLMFVVGQFNVEFLSTPIIAFGGQQTSVPVRLTLPPGCPPTDLILESREGWITIPPEPVRVTPEQSVVTMVQLYVSPGAPLGPMSTKLWVNGFSGRTDYVPFEIVVRQYVPPSTAPTAEDMARYKTAIDRFYRNNGGTRGRFGYPLGDVEVVQGTPMRRYSGGRIKLFHNGPSGSDYTWVRVRYVGFHCDEESDELSASDEPFFLIGVVGTNGSTTVRFGPYDDVDAGESRFEATYVASDANRITPPIVLAVVAMEHDEGTPEEAEAKVREVMEAIEGKLDQAAGALSGGATGSHVMPDWARDIVIGWGPEAVAAIFGMGDDEVGKTPVVLFDYKPGLLEWQPLPILGRHGPNEYTTVVDVGGGDEGKYRLFFKVDLVHSTDTDR